MPRHVLTRLALALALLAAGALPAASHASRTQESTFQDDDLLEFAPADRVAATLDQLKALGVDRVRVSLFWGAVAPDSQKQTRPASFDAADPDAYPNGSWDRYDTLLRLAAARGIGVNFDVTGPAPMWATGNPERTDIDSTYAPDPSEFAAFVTAAGRRYSGQFVRKEDRPPPPAPKQDPSPLPPLPGQPSGRRQAGATQQPSGPPLPRVDYWEIWNEPNQAGWLTPQWLPSAGSSSVQLPTSPIVYRGLADAMYSSLVATGHSKDTILVGATAPKGLNVQGLTRSIKPLPFIRELYCLDRHLQVYTGDAAKVRDCPTSDAIHAFPSQHPVLFHMTGWAHHPYELTFPPDRKPTDRDYATLANLGTLSRTLRRAYQRYGQRRPRGGLPLYLTEFGYQTDPPDKHGVSRARQAAYLNHAEYMTWREKSVRTLSQFLLVDGGEPVGRTFQSGLRFVDGRAKPALRAYELPIWLPHRHVRRRAHLRVWGLVRSAPNGTAPAVKIQFRRRHSRHWRTLATRHGSRSRGYLYTRVRMPGTGAIRLLHGDTASRSVTVRAR